MLRKRGKWAERQLTKPPNEKNGISALAFLDQKNNAGKTSAFLRLTRRDPTPSKHFKLLLISDYSESVRDAGPAIANKL
jgi:hypothetical protein